MWTGPFAYGRADVTSVLLNFFSISVIFFSFVFAIIGDWRLALNDKINYFILKSRHARDIICGFIKPEQLFGSYV
jgi:hypothetical protein